ncbi:MAG TPA: SusC/RagA family TonB-linked outer membrane protein [Gemmatimonadaceae bacterium]|nr:SusC/RagA family TonB-linked outer membrane protein [Gemmatimonadaceae bacterium]
MRYVSGRGILGLCLTLVATPLGVVAAQEAATVTGRVTGENGAPLIAAAVAIPSLGLGTQTRDDGRYSLTIPASRVVAGQTVAMQVRRVGYTPTTVQLTLRAGTITQDVALSQSALRLDEIVVTGAGTAQTRERLGNVINTVDSALIMRAAEPQNVLSALAGKAPNVVVRTQSGEPGASTFIQIRGATSVLGPLSGGNQPLIVVDNQPIDNQTVSDQTTPWPGSAGTVTQNRSADINPNDIESIEILKGAAASAIYGARAANGVILITTKRGAAGATRYTLGTTTTFDEVMKTMPLQRSYGQGSGGNAPTCAAANCNLTSLSWGPALGTGTPTYDHGAEIYRTGTTSDNNLSVSGGNQRTTFFLSGGLTTQNGVIEGPNNKYARTSLRLKATHQLIDALTLSGNFSWIDSRGKYVQKGSNTSGLLLGALRTPPDFNNQPYLDPNSGMHRSYRFPNPDATSTQLSRNYDNPFFVLNNTGNQSELGRFIGNVGVEYVPSAWLSLRYTVGADQYTDQRLQALPLTSSDNPVGSVIRGTISNLEIDHNLVAVLQRQFAPWAQTRLTLGQNLNSRRYRDTWVRGEQLIAPTPYVVQNTISWSPFETKSLRHIEAYFGQAEIDLWDQLFITAGVRNDGFSTFGETAKRATYPKASVAWAFSNAMGNRERRGLLSFGKLRAAYGETGREPPVYATITTLSSTQTLGSGFGDLITPSQSGHGGLVTSLVLGNANLRPERNRETELGVDLGLLDNRVEINGTYYDKHSSDVILTVQTNAAQTGAFQALRNAAEISNKGVELQLNVRPVTTARYAWDVGVNFGRNRGKVVSLAEGVEFVSYNNEGFTGSAGSSTVGYAPGVIRGSDFLRCGRGTQYDFDKDGTVDDIDALCGAGAAKDALFLAANGRPVVNPDDGVIADPNPDWTGGLSSALRVGRFQLSGLLDVRRGGEIWNGTRGALYRFGTHKDTEVRRGTGTFGKDFYTEVYPHVAGPGAGVVAFSTPAEWEAWFTGNGGSASGAQAQFVEDASFVKLREISLSYHLDQRAVVSRLGITSADIRVAGRNLKTWTKYKGLDPETNLGGAEWLTQGVDFFNSPLTRSFVVSVSLNR